MPRRFAGALFLLGLAAAARAQADAPPAPPPVPVIRLAPQAGGPPPRALKYALLPDPLDLTPGNAAPQWVRAVEAARRPKRRYTEKEDRWLSPETTPLGRFPAREVREFLAPYEPALRYAALAARRDRCDWELPPFTVQTMQDLSLEEVQGTRQIAKLLHLRCRLELSEGRFDQAVSTLQTGFTLARHCGEADMVIQSLVGLAIANVMLSPVEEWVQIPGSPNLYWPLTDLPTPFIDVRRPIRAELGTLYRSFPALRELERAPELVPLAPAQVETLTDDLLKALSAWEGGQQRHAPAWGERLGVAALAIKYYPDAKQHLLARGAPRDKVEALPAVQAVLLYYLDQYNRMRDDILKWMGLPPWQAWQALERLDQEVRPAVRKTGNLLIHQLVPAFSRVYAAGVRTDRHLAALRCAEALRLYAAAHGGKPPDKLAEIEAVPPPVDPLTGKGFDEFYRVQDGKAALEVPPVPYQSATTGRRVELARPR